MENNGHVPFGKELYEFSRKRRSEFVPFARQIGGRNEMQAGLRPRHSHVQKPQFLSRSVAAFFGFNYETLYRVGFNHCFFVVGKRRETTFSRKEQIFALVHSIELPPQPRNDNDGKFETFRGVHTHNRHGIASARL